MVPPLGSQSGLQHEVSRRIWQEPPGPPTSLFLPLSSDRCGWCINQLRCYSKTYQIDWVASKQQELISHSSGGKNLRLGCQHGQIMVRTLFPVADCPLLLCVWNTVSFNYAAFPGGSTVKDLPAVQQPQEAYVRSLGQEDPLEEGMATYSCIVAWRILWTEEPGQLQSMGSQRAGHDWRNIACTHMHIL